MREEKVIQRKEERAEGKRTQEKIKGYMEKGNEDRCTLRVRRKRKKRKVARCSEKVKLRVFLKEIADAQLLRVWYLMNGLHFVSVAQDPLLVGVGGEVVGGRVVGRHVEEQVTELGRRVFGTVGSWTRFRILTPL